MLDFSRAVRGRHPERQANRHGAFLGVAEDSGLVGRCLERDFVVEDAGGCGAAEANRGFVSQVEGIVGADPFVTGLDDAHAAGDRVLDTFAENAALLGAIGLGPEIEAVDVAVREPESAVMRVILHLAGHVGLHGIISGQLRAVGSDDRVEVGLLRTLENIFGEQLAADFDAHAVVSASEFDVGASSREQRGNERRK